MNQIEKAEEYAKNYKPYRDESTYSIAKKSFIAGSKSGYSAGVESGVKIARNNDKPENYYEGLSKGIVVSEKMQRYRHLKDIKEADAKYKLLAETFEEFLSDRVVIKELKDFWRNRAGLPTTEKDTKQ
jgi:hypothetical protein